MVGTGHLKEPEKNGENKTHLQSLQTPKTARGMGGRRKGEKAT